MTLKTDLMKQVASGGKVYFGRFPFDEDGTIKPIEWRVLNNDHGRVLLISEYGLDARPYHDEYPSTACWSSCTLREWLNGEFLEISFDDEERALILTSRNENNAGPATDDRVFLLSSDVMKRYFAGNDDRRCRPSPYALKQGAYESGGYGWWWLRSRSGLGPWLAVIVGDKGDGGVVSYDDDAGNADYLVRPALLLNLEC